MKRSVRVSLIAMILWPCTLVAQEIRFPIELENGQTFYPGEYTLNDKSTQKGYLHFNRTRQNLMVLDSHVVEEYNASDVISFSYKFQLGTPYAEEVRYITWKHNREWSSYARFGFFRILADYSSCAIVSSDRKPEIIDQYPDSAEVFSAKINQGITYHIILPDGRLAGYQRETIDEHLRLILGKDYDEVMMYAHRQGLSPTRFVDLFSILDYAETIRIP